MDYLYIKDRTWSLIGIAADEAPPERAPTPQEIAEAHRGGRWPGGKKEPEKSRAIIDGLGECYYPILKSLEAPVASAHREHWVTGERLAFGFVEAPIGEVNHSEVAEHETFIYVLSGELDVRVAEEQKNVKAGDIVHIPKRTSSRIAPVKDAPVRYCVVKSTPWLEAAVDEHGAATDIR
jgi:mannose-6-phosphate isomerase-like protein (cupin superfamily)